MITVMYDWKTVYVDDQDHSNPLLGNKKTVIICWYRYKYFAEKWRILRGWRTVLYFFRVMLSRRSNMATIMLIERDPLTQRLLVTRDMRLFVTRDLTFWLTFWHVWVWWYDFRKGCPSTSDTVKNWKTSYLLAGLWQLAEENLSFTSSLRLINWGCFCSLKKEIGLSTGEKKKLRGYSFFFKLSVKYQTKRSWLLFYFQAVIVLHLHKNYFVLSLFTILIIAIGHAW